MMHIDGSQIRDRQASRDRHRLPRRGYLLAAVALVLVAVLAAKMMEITVDMVRTALPEVRQVLSDYAADRSAAIAVVEAYMAALGPEGSDDPQRISRARSGEPGRELRRVVLVGTSAGARAARQR
jgi:hypothetical protein